MRKSAKKNGVQGNGHVCASFAQLTCSEGQVEDMFSAGESTEQERICLDPSEQKPLPTEKEI
jgi:hypothetical protein